MHPGRPGLTRRGCARSYQQNDCKRAGSPRNRRVTGCVKSKCVASSLQLIPIVSALVFATPCMPLERHSVSPLAFRIVSQIRFFVVESALLHVYFHRSGDAGYPLEVTFWPSDEPYFLSKVQERHWPDPTLALFSGKPFPASSSRQFFDQTAYLLVNSPALPLSTHPFLLTTHPFLPPLPIVLKGICTSASSVDSSRAPLSWTSPWKNKPSRS